MGRPRAGPDDRPDRDRLVLHRQRPPSVEPTLRDIAEAKSLGLFRPPLAAMINVVGADAAILVMNAKYHYLFWRPTTAIDPTAIKPSGDGYGPVPGFDRREPGHGRAAGWRSLITTPNHPEYPAAHGTITSAIDEVLTTFLGTNRIDVDVHGFDVNGAAGNFDAVHHFEKADEMRTETIDARLWGGVHYRTSTEAGVALGRSVAKYDLRNAFELLEVGSAARPTQPPTRSSRRPGRRLGRALVLRRYRTIAGHPDSCSLTAPPGVDDQEAADAANDRGPGETRRRGGLRRPGPRGRRPLHLHRPSDPARRQPR